MNTSENPVKVTVPNLRSRKGGAQKIVALTAYDFTMAQLLDRAGVDLLLVGDSLACVVQGHPTTIPVSLDEMIYHCRCVSRAVSRALLVGDLPFLSYQASPEQAIMSAGRLLKEGGAAAVKLEGGVAMARTIERLTEIDIPVVGHVGLTPQSYHRMGGHRIQGRGPGLGAGSRQRVLEDAQAVANAGAFALVIEGIPEDLAAEITKLVSIPTIGIGAGACCDGQILVSTDALGMNPDFCPHFVKRYASLAAVIQDAVQTYAQEVQAGTFPGAEHCFSPVNPAGKASHPRLAA